MRGGARGTSAPGQGLISEWLELVADSFRYLKLLYQGGIYTDSDTSCVRPLLEWPGLQGNSPNAHILSDPLFTLAPYLLSLSPSPPPASDERDDDDTPDPSILSPKMLQEAISASLDDALGMPQLIVAVEFDAPYTKFNWVERGYARSIQFVQVSERGCVVGVAISIPVLIVLPFCVGFSVDDGRSTLSSR